MNSGVVKILALLFPILVLSLLLFTGCDDRGENEADKVNIETLSLANYPKVDGSTSAHPLQVLIACKILDVAYDWMPYWYDETFRIWPVDEGNDDGTAYIRDSVMCSGTHGAYVNLILGEVDFILVARAASQDELDLADSAQVTLKSAPVALDAFVFIVNHENPVNSLTESEIRDIYTGSITHWHEVGGNTTKINPYRRNPNSGSQELMETLVMRDLTMMNLPDMMMLWSMMGPINAISDDVDGIGYTVYYYEQFMAPNDRLRIMQIDGVAADEEFIKSREYKYTTEVYAVIRDGTDLTSPAGTLFRWALTSEGQEVVKESGYIPYW